MLRSGKGQGSEASTSFYNGHAAVSQTPSFTNRYGSETSLPPFDPPALPTPDVTDMDPSNDDMDLGWLSSLPDSTQASNGTLTPLDHWERPNTASTSTLRWCPPLTGSTTESGTPLSKNKRQGKAPSSKAAMVCARLLGTLFANQSSLINIDVATLKTRRPTNSKKPKGRKPDQGHSESYRGHYAVEQKYRSRLNEQFAALSQAVWRRETQRIRRPETGLLSPPSGVSQASQDDRDSCQNGPKRQNKIDVLSNAIDTIQLLTERCDQKRRELDQWGEPLGSIGEMIRGIVADLVDDDQPVDPSLAQIPTGSLTTMMMHDPNGLEMRMMGLL
ncbi:helix-loop-helix DNA-binding domain-containing protein [Pochonia chlamydosporia 170]|uniref:Helix-loop-helix DNA-binding domain-containing protein n=1 Tax=Pochonia chlamydosporia 170 TaxID=1380566 RepID=A0A179F8K9_METCM|nr:helix-loop-helix DNA-binding domain-containing protein [Pochonia chlamydosporia 170]OAQ61670.1 helix-loop-helix DNA-binding domain-containing protein [Pochonia chlamydosporia 170]